MPLQESLFGNACRDHGFDLAIDISGDAKAIEKVFPLLNNGGEMLIEREEGGGGGRCGGRIWRREGL